MNLGSFLLDLADDLEVALDAADREQTNAIVADLRTVGRTLPGVRVFDPIVFACPFCCVVRDTRARLELHLDVTHRVRRAVPA